MGAKLSGARSAASGELFEGQSETQDSAPVPASVAKRREARVLLPNRKQMELCAMNIDCISKIFGLSAQKGSARRADSMNRKYGNCGLSPMATSVPRKKNSPTRRSPYLIAWLLMAWILLSGGVASAQNNANPFGITLITHGWTFPGNPMPGWVMDMAKAIQARMGGSVPIINVTVKHIDGATTPLTLVSDTLSINGSNAAAIIVVDWSAISQIVCAPGVPGYASTGSVANAVFQHIRATMPLALNLPWHMIGHSRGASLVSALSASFATVGAWTEQLTLLDSHPEWECGDLNMYVPEGTLLADSYYQDYISTAFLELRGRSVEGTAETYLNGVLPAPTLTSEISRAHILVHTYYHGTIDQSATSVDGEQIDVNWYDDSNRSRLLTGFGYSREAWQQGWSGGWRVQGITYRASNYGGTGNRYCFPSGYLAGFGLPNINTCTLAASATNVPNVSLFVIDNYKNYETGIANPVYVLTQHQTANYSLRLELDNDRNPFNSNVSGPCNGMIYSESGFPRAPSTAINQQTIHWTPTPQNIGACYIRATVTDGNGNLRYDYTNQQINILPPPPIATLPIAPTIGTAVASNGSARVAFTPGAVGTGTLLIYTATCSPDNLNFVYGEGTSSPVTVTGLTNGITYQCWVKTTSSIGTGPWSSPSNLVTPRAQPDLIVTNVSAPSNGQAGANVSVMAIVMNQGSGSAGASRLKYYLSTNSTISSADIDTTWGCDVPLLVPGATYTCQGNIGIPATTPSGIYYLGAIADATGQVIESNEANNTRAAITTTAVRNPITSTTTTATATTTTVASTTTTTGASTTTTTTTIATTTTTTLTGSSATINFVAGWNLLGNSSTGSLNVVTAFGDANRVTTVWKWIASAAKWAFYAPALVGQALTDYATSKDYDVLTTINGGEGVWVNAKTAFSMQLPAGTAVNSTSFQGMALGWNLIATGDNTTPRAFNSALSTTAPAAGDIPINLTTLWAWDATLANWYFYAPSLDKSGGLANYIQSKSYLDFDTKVLTPTTGFWVNYAGGGTSASYTVGGLVSGLVGSLVLQDNGGDNLTVSANRVFTFATLLTSGSAYKVTVLTQPIGQTCAITSGSGSATSNVTSVVVNCTNTTALPAGYVVQGGLTWMPATFIVPVTFGSTFWANANAYCTNTTINGQTGWRLPTKDELLSLANSGALNAVTSQWTWFYVWSSTPSPTGGYYVVYLDPTRIFNGTVDVGTDGNYVTCVRSNVVPGDTTPPQTTVAPSVTGTAGTSTTLHVAINEIGTGYYLVQLATVATPTVATVQAGKSFAMLPNVTATQSISGLTPSTPYKIYFVSKDASNNVQAAVQSVAFTTTLPFGYISQGGLTWMPNTLSTMTTYTYAQASALCATTINGQTGWRMPTQVELSALYSSGALIPQGSLMDQLTWPWVTSFTWSSTPGGVSLLGSTYNIVDLGSGNVTLLPDSYSILVTCVR